MTRHRALIVVLALAWSWGCNCQTDSQQVSLERARLLLPSEPQDAVGVLDVHEDLAGSEREVVMVGRIGGGSPVFDPNHALFLVVDPSAAPAHHHHDDCEENCPFCSKDAEEHTVAYVHCVDQSGQTLDIAADRLLGLKAGQTVVIAGSARHDETGNLIVKAHGIYIRG